MTIEIERLFRGDLPAPAAGRFDGFPEFNFVGGHIDADGIPVDGLVAAATRILAAEGKTLATYGLQSGPQGYLPLRRFIAGSLKSRAGMNASADEILVTSGSLQALDLVNDLLLEPGDVVIAEEASYGGALSRLARSGATCRGVRLDESGIDMDHLAQVLAEQKAAGNPARYVYTIPTVQNPTGSVLPQNRRHRMLELAEEFDCLIFEDDCYADLLWEGERPPAIRSLDQTRAWDGSRSGRVIYCGSFSKSVAPALRVGYLVADWPVIAQILPLKTDAGSGALEQLVLAEFCPDHFDGHVDRQVRVLRDKCDTIVSALQEHFGAAAEFDRPKGGIFIWVTLPDGVDTSRLAAAASKQGIAINPGADWTVDGETNRNRMRLCFGHPGKEVIREGVARLAEICHREFGVPKRSGNIER